MNPGWKAKKYDVEFLVPHNSPLVNIIMTSTLDQEANDVIFLFFLIIFSYPRNLGVSEISLFTTLNALLDAGFATDPKETIALCGLKLAVVGISQRLHLRNGN